MHFLIIDLKYFFNQNYNNFILGLIILTKILNHLVFIEIIKMIFIIIIIKSIIAIMIIIKSIIAIMIIIKSIIAIMIINSRVFCNIYYIHHFKFNFKDFNYFLWCFFYSKKKKLNKKLFTRIIIL